MGPWRAPAALVLLLALAAPVTAQADDKPYVDATRGDRPARERISPQALTKRLGAQAVVDVDAATGTPRVLGRLNGTLTAPSSGSPEAIADAYVRSHLSDLGLTSSDLDTLGEPDTATAPSGVSEVRWEQSVDGIPSANTELRVNVTRDGRVLNVLGSPAHAMDVDSTTPSLDAGEAIRAVQDDIGAFKSLSKTKGPAGTTRDTTFRGGSSASLELLQRSDGTVLVWRVYYDAGPGEFYDATVDARTGDVLKRANITKSATDGTVWERYAVVGAQRLVDIGNGGAWLSDVAPTLNGPNVHAWSDLDDGNDVDLGEEVDRTGGGFGFLFQNLGGCPNDHACGWNGGNTWTTNRAQTTVQAFYFANKFHDHLAAAPIGFNGFENGDKLLLQTDDGANGAGGTPDGDHRNNANMLTLPEGQSPTMQMYLFTGGGFRNVSGSDDAAIVYHEYTHGLSSRLVTATLNGPGALNSPQAGAMGEAWSDWYAMDFLVNEGAETDTGADGDLDVGEGTDAGAHNLRSEPIDCAVGSIATACAGVFDLDDHPGGYTYGDFAQIAGRPEVHADGEIWAQTLWDLRTALGSALAEQLITDGMRLSPPEPSFLDERNAIVQADVALGGQHLTQIWTVFAHRGMGYYAGTFDGSDTTPTGDGSMPPAANAPTGTITGTVINAETNQPLVGAKVGVGGLTSGLFNFSATTDASGNYRLTGVPEGDYKRLNFSFDGFDPVSRGNNGTVPDDPPVRVLGGQTTTRSAILRRDWASLKGDPLYLDSNHPEYQDLGCGPLGAIDQSLGTGWSSDTPASSADDPYLIVKLPTNTPITIRTFGVDPKFTCGDRFADSTNVVKVETSTTTSSTCATGFVTARQLAFASDTWGKLNEFTPLAGTTSARCVKLTLLSSFGGASDFRDLSEFGVYTAAAPVQPAAVNPIPSPTPTPTPTPQATSTPVPTATPTPAPPVKPVTFKLPASGSKGAAALTVSCVAQCTATATLTADKATAKKLKLTTLGKAAKMGKGSLRFTVKLSAKARKAMKKRHLKSVTVTLKVSVRSGGKTTTSTKRVKIKI